jgi:hypothetical protein
MKLPRIPGWAFVVLGVLGLVLELVAVFNDAPGDTVTEQTTRVAEGIAGAVAIVAFFVWATAHFIRRVRWRRDTGAVTLGAVLIVAGVLVLILALGGVPVAGLATVQLVILAAILIGLGVLIGR